MDEDDTVTIDVLDNDSDPDGDTLVITEVDGLAITDGGPAVTVGNGTVSLVGGELIFTPRRRLQRSRELYLYHFGWQRLHRYRYCHRNGGSCG